MMQIIRDKAQGFIAWAIIVLIAIVFSLWGIGDYFSERGDTVAAKVNGQKITWPQVEDFYNRIVRQNFESGNFDFNNLDINKFKIQIRQLLVDERALVLETLNNGFSVSEDQVFQLILSTPRFHDIKGRFSSEKYNQFLSQTSLSDNYYQQQLKQQLLLGQLRSGLSFSNFILPNELDYMVRLWHQQRDFGYFTIPAAKFSNEFLPVESDIQAYYDKNKLSFYTVEKVSIAYIELSINALIDKMRQEDVTDDILEEYYKTHQSFYNSPEMVNVKHILIVAPKGSDKDISGEARSKAEDLLAKIKLGEDFNNLAKEESQDAMSAKQGGDIGWVGRGEVDSVFETAAFELNNLGDISDVVQSEFGYHVIKLVEKREATVKTFDTVKEQVYEHYRRERAEAILADKGEELANIAFEHPDSLELAAESLGLPIQQSAPFSFAENIEDKVLENSIVRKVAFQEDIINQSRNSDLIKIDDDRYIVLRVRNHYPGHQQSLDEAREEIIVNLSQQYATDSAQELGQQLLAELETGKMPNGIAKTYGIDWNVEKNISRQEKNIKSDIIKHVFSLPKPVENNKVNSGLALSNGDYIVLSLSAVNYLHDQEEVRSVIANSLLAAKSHLEYDLYADELLGKAEIELKELPF